MMTPYLMSIFTTAQCLDKFIRFPKICDNIVELLFFQANKALTPVEYTNYTMVGHAHMDGNNVGDHFHLHQSNNQYQVTNIH